MKKGVVVFGVFTLFLLVLLSFGVFAAAPTPGTCAIVAPNECVEASGNYRIMGLSATTNAHAQVPYSDYSFVLCCGFGTGSKTCTTTPPNKIIGLSSITNAHAEAPLQTNYLTKVCYEDLECKSSASNCGVTGSDVETYKLNFSSLSSATNAHVGGINDFPTKICCKSAKFLSPCTIKSVGTSWNQVEANEGVNVYLTVKGSGVECDGQSLSIEVIGATESNATSVSFTGSTALSWWTAKWKSAGVLGGDYSYDFNASVVGVLSYSGKSMKSSNSLTVKQISTIDHCATITSCEEYTDSNECNTDTPCAKATEEGISQGVACDGIKTYCSCSWDASALGTISDPKCKFRWSEVSPGSCPSGYTLCHDSTTGVDYCYPGSTCPTGNEPVTNGDSVCDVGEGCTNADCNGRQDSCVSGATCVSGVCSGTTVPTNVNCSYGFTLCKISGTNYCYPGSSCPSGQIPPSNGNGKCDAGEGCLSTDCKDGDRDSCVSGIYCLLGKCAAIQDPITVGSVGGCKITQTIEKNCDVEPVGYKIISWTGTWAGTIDISNPAYQKCIAGGRKTIPCPAQIQLPFFDYYELAITLGVIALIYISLIFRRKLKRKKK